MSWSPVVEYSRVGVLAVIYVAFFYTMIGTLGFGLGWNDSGDKTKLAVNPEACNKYGKRGDRHEKCMKLLDNAFHLAERTCSNYVALLDKCKDVNRQTCARDRANVDACFAQVMDAEIRSHVPASAIASI